MHTSITNKLCNITTTTQIKTKIKPTTLNKTHEWIEVSTSKFLETSHIPIGPIQILQKQN